MSLKILFAIGQLTLGGSERRLLDLNEELLKRGLKTYISNLSGDYVKDGKEFYARKNKLKRIKELVSDISSFKPDVIHCFDLQSTYYVMMALRLSRKKIPVIGGFGASKFVNPSVEKFLNYKMLQPDCYVLNSQQGVELLRKTLKDEKKLYYIPNGLNPDRFKNIEIQKPEWAKRDNIIGYIGKLNESKHGERMIDVAKEFENDDIDVNFVIMGEGPYFKEAQERVASDKYLKEHVILTGNIDNAASYAKYFTIGTLCSDTEGLPNVLLEYMALGKPSVSTNVGEVEFVLNNGKCGIIIDKYDKIKFKDAIKNLLQNNELYYNFAEASLNRFQQEFRIDIMADKYTKMYNDLSKKKISDPYSNKSKDFFETDLYLSSNNIPVRKNILSKMGLNFDDKKLLDLGCGDGSLALLHYFSFSKIVFVDLSDFMISQLKNNIDKIYRSGKSPEVEIYRTDVCSFHTNQKFDLIFCIGVLSYVSSLESIFKIFKTHLTENGMIIIQFSDNASLEMIFKGLFKKRKKSNYVLNETTGKEINELIDKFGFKIKQEYRYPETSFRKIFSTKTSLQMKNFLSDKSFLNFGCSEVILLLEK